MNRRDFARTLFGTALGAAALSEAPFLGAETMSPEDKDAGVPFKFSVMLWTVYRDRPFEERLEKVAEAGYNAVELVREFKQWSAQDLRNANARKRSLGITFDATAGLARGVADPRDREAFLSDLRGMLPIMDKLECSSLIVLSGNRVAGTAPEVQHRSCVEGLSRAAEIAEKQNVRLLLENIDPEENPNYYLTSVAEGFKIIGEVNHPRVQVLYDFFHEQISAGNLITKLEKNIERVGLVHIADVPGRHEPGTGEINYANIFKKLGQLKYSGYAAMEFRPSSDPVETLRAAREMALRAART